MSVQILPVCPAPTWQRKLSNYSPDTAPIYFYTSKPEPFHSKFDWCGGSCGWERSGMGDFTARLHQALQKPPALSLVGSLGWEKDWMGLSSSQSSSSHSGGREGNEMDKQPRKTPWLKKQAAFFSLRFGSGPACSGAAPG